MAGQSRKWMILVATIWIQAFTGTNFDFSAYSSEMKSVLGVSQVQLNYLATASDLGKAVGWSSGVALMWLPLWAVMFAAALMGLVGYGVQWLVISNVITLPYFVVFLLCLLAGCSICWFNTVCFVLCIKNFPSAMPLALSLTVSFNGVSAALYNLAVKSLNPSSTAVYLLLNALVPLFTSVVALIPILLQPPLDSVNPDIVKRDHLTFLKLNVLAIVTGLYLLFLHPSDSFTARFLLSGAIFLMIIPLGIPGILYAREWFHRTIYSSIRIGGSGFILVDADDLELHKQLLSREASRENGLVYSSANSGASTHVISRQNTAFEGGCSCKMIVTTNQLLMLGQEHKAGELVRRLDFWLYFLAYFCGGTIGLVYSNNLGQIAQSLGHSLMTSKLITIYSSFSFFGRLLSAAPDFIRTKVYFARTGWLAIALLPTPIAFCLLSALGGNLLAIEAGTALIGLSSGFIFAAAVSITSELFGPESVGVNHNILITNIPIGSLVYGFLAAMVYDSNALPGVGLMGESLVCMGRECYSLTFVWWGCISLLGLASSVLLFLRTRPAYWRFERSRRSAILS
ncbi:Major facilitator superfamily protein [Perilla frutescens var. hirtella]|uniref:Major facilitator superfamily protein n=1 Tax=Perilla frutescens var. hirtella TaxID=608512 RepID=A0AAD4JD64_PERFH|nr:Major facilitator superfamily protein [Perilla frutescens var. hirtella]KAH6831259.1 Major facilitator superfamily protein [Perilla frutescens var. hirtella]